MALKAAPHFAINELIRNEGDGLNGCSGLDENNKSFDLLKVFEKSKQIQNMSSNADDLISLAQHYKLLEEQILISTVSKFC